MPCGPRRGFNESSGPEGSSHDLVSRREPDGSRVLPPHPPGVFQHLVAAQTARKLPAHLPSEPAPPALHTHGPGEGQSTVALLCHSNGLGWTCVQSLAPSPSPPIYATLAHVLREGGDPPVRGRLARYRTLPKSLGACSDPPPECRPAPHVLILLRFLAHVLPNGVSL